VEVQEILGDVSLATALPVLARRLIERHDIEILLIGLGDQGTLLTTADEQVQIQPPKVEVLSAVGAGDSFLGALVLALERDWSVADAVRYGVAAAASAVETEISRLCDRNATEAYFRQISAARQDGVFVSARRT
jgi:6-phosphofructokinase 2